jgi:glycosyltransferase involved in cell wall biosynthesis
MNSLNILFVSHVFPPYFWWGQSKVARDYAKSLSNQWYNITVITHLFPWLKKQENLDGINVVRFSSVSGLLFRMWLFWPKWLNKRLKNNIKKYDIVYIHGIYTLYEFIVARACKKYNIPYIVMPHGVWNISKQKEKVLIKRIFIFLFSNYVSNNANKIIFCSENEKKDYEIIYKDCSVINNWINQDSWNAELQRITQSDENDFREKYDLWNKKIIFSMWRLSYWKRFDKVINYLSEFLKDNENYILLIVWPDWWEFKNLNNQILKKRLENNVFIIQWLYDKEKMVIFKISDLFILASDHEGFPIVICEAISSKIPCLISDECNISWCKWFVEIFTNKLEFKDKLNILINKGKIVNEKYIESFDIKNSVNSLCEVISEIINSSIT